MISELEMAAWRETAERIQIESADPWVAKAYDGLPTVLAQALINGGWKDPTTLDCAFDDLPEAIALVEGILQASELLPGVAQTLGAALFAWQVGMRRNILSTRKRAAGAGFEVRAANHEMRRDVGPSTEMRVLDSEIMGMCKQVGDRWRCKLDKKVALASTEDQRKKLTELERNRWLDHVVDILKGADLPVIAKAALTSDPLQALRRAVGRRRAKTLRSRVKIWQKVRLWMQCVHNHEWPAHIGQMLDYLSDITSDTYGKSVPGSISGALSFFEAIGCVADKDKISTDALWRSCVDERTMSAGNSGAAIKKAFHYFVIMLLSLELFIVSQKPKYKRAIAWLKLVKVFATLRADDTQGIDVMRLILTPLALRGILRVTKTTGPGKRTGEVPFYVTRQAGFSGRDWLLEGFNLWQEMISNRDYFVGAPNRDFTSMTTRMADYSVMSSMSRAVLGDLVVPERQADGSWEEKQPHMLLLPYPGTLFFTEHSERHEIPTITAANGKAKPDRDSLGRWGIGDGSDSYLMTMKHVVLRLQRETCLELSEGPSNYEEEELFEGYRMFLQKRMPGQNLQPWLAHMVILGADNTLGQPWPLAVPANEMEVAAQAADQVSDATVESRALLGPSMLNDDDRPMPCMRDPFWMSCTASGFRRLHRFGGCHIKPELVWQWEAAIAGGKKADKPCLLCFPDLRGVDLDDLSDCGSVASTGSSSTDVSAPPSP